MNQNLPTGTLLKGKDYTYTIVRTLGQGSFGITYLATTQVEASLGNIIVNVAVKEFFMKEINSREGNTVTGGTTAHGLFDKYREKFRREAQNLAKMHHPGIVKVYESFDANETSYIAMEYLSGGSLDGYILRHNRLPVEEAVEITHRIGEALEHMHASHMLHLDMKPSNVMLNDDGDPIIIDFGLSKQYDDNGEPESSTTVGGGTPGYAPIEQASYRDGDGFPVTMDVYALGATLFKMLTGHRPPEADRIMNDGFPYADLKGVGRSTVAVVAKAMAFRKADRYPSVQKFLEALDARMPESEDLAIEDNNSMEVEVVNVTPAPLGPSKSDETNLVSKPGNVPSLSPKRKKKRWWIFLVIAVAILGGVLVYHQANDSARPLGPEPENGAVETITVGDVEFSMVYVKGGSFMMGAQRTDKNAPNYEEEAWENEGPVHKVTLDGYYIGETEVTQALWKAVMGTVPTDENGFEWTDEWGLGDNYPAYNLSYNKVQEFIAKLNEMTGKKFRMPTEAEWEYAARGGIESHGFRFSGSNNIDEVAWYGANSGEMSHPVKGKMPNELGLYDMTGNLSEWCSDWFGSYIEDSETNPIGPSTGHDRVYRGGCWFYDAGTNHLTMRLGGNQSSGTRVDGFRLAMSR